MPRPLPFVWEVCFRMFDAWVGKYLQSSPPFADSVLALFLQNGFPPRTGSAGHCLTMEPDKQRLHVTIKEDHCWALRQLGMWAITCLQPISPRLMESSYQNSSFRGPAASRFSATRSPVSPSLIKARRMTTPSTVWPRAMCRAQAQ